MSWSPFSSRKAFKRMGATGSAKKNDDWSASSAWSNALGPSASKHKVDKVAPTVVVAAKRNLKLALLLLFLDLAACGATALAYIECLPPIIAKRPHDVRRTPAIVGTSLVALLFVCVLLARLRYVFQSNRPRCTGSVRWQLASVMQPLLSIPVLFYATYVWVLCEGVWNSTASLVFLGALLACKLVNVQAAYKHRRTLKMHIVALENEIVQGYELERADEPTFGQSTIDTLLGQATDAPLYVERSDGASSSSADEFDSIDVGRAQTLRADDNEPMRIDQPPPPRPARKRPTSAKPAPIALIDGNTLKRVASSKQKQRAAHSTAPARRAPESPRALDDASRRTKKSKKHSGRSSSRSRRAATLAGGASAASHTSVDDAEESVARIDQQPW